MPEGQTRHDTRTSLNVQKDTRDRIHELKPYESVSFDHILNDMIEVYREKKEL